MALRRTGQGRLRYDARRPALGRTAPTPKHSPARAQPVATHQPRDAIAGLQQTCNEAGANETLLTGNAAPAFESRRRRAARAHTLNGGTPAHRRSCITGAGAGAQGPAAITPLPAIRTSWNRAMAPPGTAPHTLYYRYVRTPRSRDRRAGRGDEGSRRLTGHRAELAAAYHAPPRGLHRAPRHIQVLRTRFRRGAACRTG